MHASKFPPFVGLDPVSPIRDTYKLQNDSEGNRILVPFGKENLVEMVQSCREQALDAVLDRFLNEEEIPLPVSDSPFDQSFLDDDFDIAAEYIDHMEEVREALNLPLDMSYKEISSLLEEKYNTYKKGGFYNAKKQAQDDAPSEESQNVSSDESPTES